jgi:hypothetical protein
MGMFCCRDKTAMVDIVIRQVPCSYFAVVGVAILRSVLRRVVSTPSLSLGSTIEYINAKKTAQAVSLDTTAAFDDDDARSPKMFTQIQHSTS